MTEQEWLTTTDPTAMLRFLLDSRLASERKFRLWAVACYRRVWGPDFDPAIRRMVQVAEAVADGRASSEQRVAACNGLRPLLLESNRPAITAAHLGARSGFVTTRVALHAANAHLAVESVAQRGTAWREEQLQQADLTREIFNPFRRPSPLPALVLAWNGGAIAQLANAVYDNRILPSGAFDRDRVLVLADALEEAGADVFLLAHLREPRRHVRGCFVVDLLTGRE